MQVKFICPTWGLDISGADAIINKITDADYDGLEIGFPITNDKYELQLLKQAREKNLFVVAQHYDVDEENPDSYLSTYKQHLLYLASLKPDLINAQSGKDYFSFEENIAVLQAALDIESATGVKIVHETHRGKFSYSPVLMKNYFDRLPALRITADFSHYCVVTESLLQSAQQANLIAMCIGRADHIHARVRHPQAAQVNDPRAPEWDEALASHVAWWDQIVEKKRDADFITITPEFGPAPYMPAEPYSRAALAPQWEINLYMKEILANRYS